MDAENQTQVLCKEQYRPVTAEPAPAMKILFSLFGWVSPLVLLVEPLPSSLSTWFRLEPISLLLLDDACNFAFHCPNPARCFAKQTTLSFSSVLLLLIQMKDPFCSCSCLCSSLPPKSPSLPQTMLTAHNSLWLLCSLI